MRALGRFSVSQFLFVAVVLGGLAAAAGCSGNGIPPGMYPTPIPVSSVAPEPTSSVIVIINSRHARPR
jgi:hypothetical protein